MYFVHPNDSERFALRMILLYRKGCDSFKSLKTVNKYYYNTFREALVAMGLAKDDNEWNLCLSEASEILKPKQLRDLFV